MVNDHFEVFLDSVDKKFLSFFALGVIREIGLKFSYFVGSLNVFFLSIYLWLYRTSWVVFFLFVSWGLI